MQPQAGSTPGHPPSTVVSAAEERRRRLLLRQHPGLALLEAAPARLTTLRLYLDNPDFSSLKALASLQHLRELSLMVRAACAVHVRLSFKHK